MASNLQGKTIAITRPAGQATKLNALLTAAGAKTLSYPLIAIAPLPDIEAVAQQFQSLDDTDWLVFISSNAVHHGMAAMQQVYPSALPSHLKYAAIGPVTADTLTEYGVDQVLIPESRFDSEALLAMPPLQNMQGQKVMIVRGVGGRELLANALTARGASVTFAECYQRINPQADALALYDPETKQTHCEAMVVTSSEAMRHLLDLTKINPSNAKQHWLKTIKLCVNLPRVAEPANALGLRTFIAGKPGDEAMLNCLTEALSK